MVELCSPKDMLRSNSGTSEYDIYLNRMFADNS